MHCQGRLAAEFVVGDECTERGAREAGCEHVDSHSIAGGGCSCRPGESDHASLGAADGLVVTNADFAGDGAVEDHGTATCPLQHGHDGLEKVERGERVLPPLLFEFLCRRGRQGLEHDGADSVCRSHEFAECFLRGSDGVREIIRRLGISLDGDDTFAECGFHGRKFFRVAGEQRELMALIVKSARDRGPDAACRTGDEKRTHDAIYMYV